MEETNNDHEKAGDNTDVNIGNNSCFARCSDRPLPYQYTHCPTKEPKIITDLSTPQIEATGKPKPNYEVLENNLISLKKDIVSLKELIMGEIITVNKKKSIEETQSRDEVKHLIEENSSKTAIIKILLENKNHHVTHSSNTSNSFIQQNDFTQTPKYVLVVPIRNCYTTS